MISYLILHALFSLLLIVLLRLLTTVSPGIKFYLAVLGLGVWLLPLPLLRVPVSSAPEALTALYELRVFAAKAPAEVAPMVKEEPGGEVAAPFSFQHLALGAWFGIAVLIWAWGVQRNRAARRLLEKRSRNGDFLWRDLGMSTEIPLSIMPGAGAMTTGLMRPRIWIGEAHLGGSELEALLVHELTHVRQKDNYWILGLFWIDGLFWWNPLVRLLSAKARLYLELRCDRACQRRLGAVVYREALARTLLRTADVRPSPGALAISFISSRRTNMIRIKHIQRSDQMKVRHILTLLVFFSLSSLLFALPIAGPVQTEKGDVLIKIPPANKEKPTPRVGEKGVEPPVFTKKIAPIYPKQGIQHKMQGYVILQARLRKDGVIDQLKVLRGLGKGAMGFEEAAIEALKQWEYLPGRIGGEPADVAMTLKIDFVLGKDMPLPIVEWSLEGEKDGYSAPRALMDSQKQSRITKGLHLSVPVFVRLDHDGSILDWGIEESDLNELVEPLAIVERVEAVLDAIRWEPAKGELDSLVTDLKVMVPVSLKSPVPER